MKRPRFRHLVVVAATLCLTACGLPGLSPDTSADTSTTTPTVASTPPSTPAPSASTGGADAAPGEVPFDSSAQAKNDFFAWWSYEIQVPQDDQPLDTVYTAGMAVCTSRYAGAGPDAITTVIERDFGFTRSGAAGIYKAAVEALCPQYNLGTYKTYFDRNTDKFIVVAITQMPQYNDVFKVWDFGWFMKEACATMAHPQLGGAAVYQHMSVQYQLALIQGGRISQQDLYVLIKHAVNSGCDAYTDNLPAPIHNS